MSGYEFIPATHEYLIDGRPVPSVTAVLRDLIPGWTASEWHMGRGEAVHACAAMIARGADFDHDPQIAPQVAAARAFFAEVKPRVIAIETQVYSRAYQYAGRLDLFAGIGNRQAIVDFKATLTPSVPYQCAAYALAYPETGGGVWPRYGVGVELSETGYRLSEFYDLRRYRQEWLALLTAYRVRRKCGIKEGEA